MTPVAAPVSDVVSFAEQINTFPDTFYAAFYQENVIFTVPYWLPEANCIQLAGPAMYLYNFPKFLLLEIILKRI